MRFYCVLLLGVLLLACGSGLQRVDQKLADEFFGRHVCPPQCVCRGPVRDAHFNDLGVIVFCDLDSPVFSMGRRQR